MQIDMTMQNRSKKSLQSAPKSKRQNANAGGKNQFEVALSQTFPRVLRRIVCIVHLLHSHGHSYCFFLPSLSHHQSLLNGVGKAKVLDMAEMAEATQIPLSLVAATGCTTLVLASALAYVLLQTRKQPKTLEPEVVETAVQEVDKKIYPGGQLSVYYGTQTGTAESFAKQLEREGPEHGFLVHVVDLEDVEVDDIVAEARRDAESGITRAIFLSATYGEGEAPDNSTTFAASLKEKASSEILFDKIKDAGLAEPESLASLLEYCVFGLGNRQYDHFNAMAKFIDHAFERVGGVRILPMGVGDDDNDLEGDFESWKEKLWPMMETKYVQDLSLLKKKKKKAAEHKMPQCQYVVEYCKIEEAKSTNDLPLDQVHASSRHYFTSVDCPVQVVRELRTSEDSGSTVHVEVDISKAKGITYTTADNLGVLPVNDSATVEAVAKSLGYDLDAVFVVKAAEKHEWTGAPFPMPISIRECLTRYCDLAMAPRRSDLKVLAAYAKNPTDIKALMRMAAKEGKAEYKEKIVDEYCGLVHILQRCPSIELPLEHFLSICPRLQTRFFTISSSSTVHPKTIHLTVAVTKAERKDGSVFNGVCSTYLAKSGKDMIRVFNRPSTFRLPKDPSRPILMIGPGTGVAPMRALLQERSHQKNSLKQNVGTNVLYFGCKTRSQDYIYQDELEAFQNDGVLNKLYLAFSRENSEKKVYVQHLLLENAEETWDLLDKQGAYIYVCGGVKMGRDVSEALKEIISAKAENVTDWGAKDYLAKMTEEGRFVQELWA
jgi:NADPH-ferrihemoprotein reductase